MITENVPLLGNSDFSILSQWLIYAFWNYIYILCFAVILSFQVIFMCGYERKNFVIKKKAASQENIIIAKKNIVHEKIVEAPPAYVNLPTQPSPCPEDTLYNVTSLIPDNEASIYQISPTANLSQTHSILESHRHQHHHHQNEQRSTQSSN